MSIFNRKSEMQISDAELSSMTRDLDELHRDSFPKVERILDDAAATIARERAGMGRRGFLLGVGGVVVVGGLAACSSSGGTKTAASSTPATGGSSTPATSGSTTATASQYTGDLKAGALAAALENLAVGAYTLAGQAATAGKLGKVPPAIVQFVTTVSAQHKEHAAAWNSVLTKNKLPTITGTPLTIAGPAVAALKKATTLTDVATQALGLETAAAETYLFATANVQDPAGIEVAATIAPVENMHAAILNFVLGKYPVPSAFLGLSNAVMPSAFTG